MFDVRYQMHLNDIHSLGFMGSLTDYVMSQQFLALLDKVIDSDEKHVNFEKHKIIIQLISLQHRIFYKFFFFYNF